MTEERRQKLLQSSQGPGAEPFSQYNHMKVTAVDDGTATVEEAVAEVKLRSRQYAKRQLTWMRREEDVLWVDALEPDAYDRLEAYYTQGEAK